MFLRSVLKEIGYLENHIQAYPSLVLPETEERLKSLKKRRRSAGEAQKEKLQFNPKP